MVVSIHGCLVFENRSPSCSAPRTSCAGCGPHPLPGQHGRHRFHSPVILQAGFHPCLIELGRMAHAHPSTVLPAWLRLWNSACTTCFVDTAPAAPGLQDQLKVDHVVLVPLKTNHVAPRRRQNPWQVTPDSLSLISQAVRDDTSRSQSRLAQLRKRCFHVALKLLKCLTLLYMVYGTYLRAYSNPIDEFYKPTNITFFGSAHCSFRSARVQPLLHRWQKDLTWKPPKNAEKLETWKEKGQIIQLPFWRYCSIFLWLIL